jgi:Protein of unknown function (DUF3305)
MAQEHLRVGVVVERRLIADNPWIDHAWCPVAVLPNAPAIAPWTSLGKDERGERFYLGPADLTLYSVDTAHFRDNFTTGHPSLWVSVRLTGLEPELEIVGVTADPFEGEAFCETMGDIIEMLPMPADVAARITAFYDTHHVERAFFKRQRDVLDPRKGGKNAPQKLRPPAGPAVEKN